MRQRDNGITYTLPGDVRAARVNYAGGYRTADLYGQRSKSRAVTPYMLTLSDGRERRVYAMAYGNGTVPYIIVKGVDILLDERTRDALARMHASGDPYKAVRPHAELVADMKAEILDDVREGTVPATVTDYSELHDFVDANMYGYREDDENEDWDSAMVGPAQDDVHAWLQAGGISYGLRPRMDNVPGEVIVVDDVRRVVTSVVGWARMGRHGVIVAHVAPEDAGDPTAIANASCSRVTADDVAAWPV